MSEDPATPAPPVGGEHPAHPRAGAAAAKAPLSVDMTGVPSGPEPAAERKWFPRIPTTAALAVLVTLVAVVELLPTLRLSYAYDDLDCLNLAADVIAGKRSYSSMAFMPHNEHLMPILRAVFHASAVMFGVNPIPFRLLVLAAHALTAWLLGLLALRYSGRAAAAIATGLAYVIPGGLSSMPLWVLVASGVPIGLVGISGAMLALAHQGSLGVRRARLLAGAGCLFAVGAASGLVPLLVGPLLLDVIERRRAGERRWLGPFGVFCLAVMVACVLATALLYRYFYGHRPETDLLRSPLGAGFLMALAPYRVAFPGLGLPIAGSKAGNLVLWTSLGLVVAAPVAALLLALWRRGANRLAEVAIASAVGPIGNLFLVGAARGSDPIVLYEADRYFFPLLLPLALLAGAATAAVATHMDTWSPRQRAAVVALCVLAVGAELALHRRAVVNRVPFGVFATHGRRFAQLTDLAWRLRTGTSLLPQGSPPAFFPDDDLWLPDVHNNRISARLLLDVIGSPSESLRLSDAPVGERDTLFLNAIFVDWARSIDEPQLAPKVVAGGLAKAEATRAIDFRTGSQEGSVVDGFYGWEGTYRWMGGRGRLRLTLSAPSLQLMLAAPISQLRQKKGRDAIVLSVTAVDEPSGAAVPLGSVRVDKDEPSVYALDASPFVSRFPGHAARLVLEADYTWRPSLVLEGSQDERVLSVIVMAAGPP